MIKYDPNRKNIYIRWLLIRVGLMVYDILAVSAAYFFALMVRFYVNNEFHAMAVKYIPAFLQFAPFYAVCCLVVFAGCGLYNSLWKYAGMHDLNRIAVSGFITCAIQVVGTLLFVRRMPVSYYVLGAVFQLALITASRFSYRVLLIEARHFFRHREHLLNTMIVGTGESSRTLLKYLERDDSSIARPVCVVDFANAEICGTMAGVPVIGGVEQIGQAVKKYNVDRIVLADSVMPIHICKEVREIAREAGVGVQANAAFFLHPSTRRMALRLLRGDKVHLLGSDCHNLTSRAPNLGAAIAVIEKHLGEEPLARLSQYGNDILRGMSAAY